MSSEFSALLNGQRDLHGCMSRFVDNLKKMGASNITQSAIETRIKLLDQMWAKFETQYDLIRAAYKERYDESKYVTSNFFEIAENTYVQQRSALAEYLKRFQGSTKKLIRLLTVTGENYTRAWALLEKHYKNKKELIRSNFATFTAMAKMKADTAEELSRVYHAVTAAVNAQESIGKPNETHGMDLFNHLIIDLFDPRTRLEWKSSTCDSFNPPEYDTLLNFLSKRILTLNAAKPRSAAKVTSDASRSAKSHFVKHGSSSSLCPLQEAPLYHAVQWVQGKVRK
ncbi:uncharacterized protein [Linepithema humile]|uniref:uncharacterized protein n=1 Tax=Linepithema humile TaxID=83485 RepID=UPI00351F163A